MIIDINSPSRFLGPSGAAGGMRVGLRAGFKRATKLFRVCRGREMVSENTIGTPTEK